MMLDERIISAARGTAALIQKYWTSINPLLKFSPLEPVRADLTVPTPALLARLSHVLWCCQEIERMVRAGKREKAMRWLGFSQGVVWAVGAASVEELKDLNKPSLIRVTCTPTKDEIKDHPLPWVYEEDAFVMWVWEVFLEGYKKEGVKVPTTEEALAILHALDYTVEEVR